MKRRPPVTVLVTFCPACGRVGCAVTGPEIRRDNIAAGHCEFCVGLNPRIFVTYRKDK